MAKITWLKDGNRLKSDCGVFLLYNTSKTKGGEWYVVMSTRHDNKAKFRNCHYRLEMVGTYQECYDFNI